MADFTKTGSQVDEWAVVSAASFREGAASAIPDDIQISAEITSAKVEATAHDGEDLYTVEVSGNTTGDEDWTELVSFKGTAGTAATTTLDAEEAAAQTVISVASTTGFETPNDRFFFKNGTIANSEIVRGIAFVNDDTITIRDGLTNTQQSGISIYNIVDQWIIMIPAEFRRYRVLVYNADADCDIVTRTREAKVTDAV